MNRRAIWAVAFGVAGVFVLAGAFLGHDGQRTWALVSTIGVVGIVVLLVITLVIAMLQRLVAKARPFRRR